MHMGQMAAGQTTARRANTSRYAILGVLSRRAMSGYDVKKLIERSIAHFWNESHAQIYPILNPLPARLEPVRSELLLKLFLGRAGPVANSAAQIEHVQTRHRALLDTYDGIERQLRKDMRGHPELPYWLITLRCGQHRSRAMLVWC